MNIFPPIGRQLSVLSGTDSHGKFICLVLKSKSRAIFHGYRRNWGCYRSYKRPKFMLWADCLPESVVFFSWCFMMFHDVSWSFMIFHDLSWCLNVEMFGFFSIWSTTSLAFSNLSGHQGLCLRGFGQVRSTSRFTIKKVVCVCRCL